MLWRRAEDRWAREQRRRPGGTRRAGWSAVGVTEKGRRGLVEKGATCTLSPGAAKTPVVNSPADPIFTRWRTTQPNAKHG